MRVVQRAKVEACEVATFRQRGRLADKCAQDLRAHASSVARSPTQEVLRQRRDLEGSTRRHLDVPVAARRGNFEAEMVGQSARRFPDALVRCPREPAVGGKGFGGYWSRAERELLHITHKELRAVIKGIRMNADALRGHVVRLWEDNMAVVHIIRAKTSRSAVLMAELRDLLDLLRELDIILLPKYIRSQLNPSDYFSRLTDRDAWMLRPRLRASLRRHAENVLQEPISLDAFACHQTAIVPRYASRHSEPAALAHDGLALDWTAEQGAVWICPPFALLPAIIQKLEDEKPAAVLIAPKWQMASWWPNLMRLGGLHVPLPRSKHAVISLHGHKVEPFLNGNVELIAVLLSRTR